MNITNNIGDNNGEFKILDNYHLITFTNIDSTNEAAKRLIKSDTAPDKFLIISDEQSDGYGQKGRKWESLKGNLHLSISLYTVKPLQKLQELVFLSAVVISEYIKQFLPEESDIKLKWPNDVLVNNKKIAGILLETVKNKDKQYVIIGIGINLSKTPTVQDQKVTSLNKEGAEIISPQIFIPNLIKQFDSEYNKWDSGDNFNQIRKDWLNKANGLGTEIIINDGKQNISGIFYNIDKHGAIVLKNDSGENITIDHGRIIS